MQMNIKWKYNNAEIKKKKSQRKKKEWYELKLNMQISLSPLHCFTQLCCAAFCNVFKIKMHK